MKNIFYLLFVAVFFGCVNDDTPAAPDVGLGLEVPVELQAYYATLTLTDDMEANYEALRKVTLDNHGRILSYGSRHNFLYDADANLMHQDSVVLMYSGENRYWEEYTSSSNDYSPQTFNTEHIYPRSLLRMNDAFSDLHHLRSTDENVNTLRGNAPYIDGSGTYERTVNGWYPGDEWKGDVARMILYLNVRYREDISKVGSLDLFLKWNTEDPVSEFEEQRNEVIFGAQGNRNPFIDNPYLATIVYGGTPAENTWD